MNHEAVFSAAGALSMLGWLALGVSPYMPRWSDRIAGGIVPVVLAVTYVAILLSPTEEGGGFSTFAEVTVLFSKPDALLAGWIHFLTFDLMVGAWVCRRARAEGIEFWWVLPCLAVTFLLGPAGLLMFAAVAAVHRVRGPSAVGE